MTSSNSLKKLISIGAAMMLAVGGSLVAAQPASATVSSNVESFEVYRLSSATRASGSSTYTVTAGSNERVQYFTYDEDFGAQTSAGALVVTFSGLPSGASIASNPLTSNAATVITTGTGGGTVNGTSSSSPFTSYSVNLGAQAGRTGMRVTIPLWINGMAPASTFSITATVTYGGVAVAPIGSHAVAVDSIATISGTSAKFTRSGSSYTAVAGDVAAVAISPSTNSTSCIWPGSSTVPASGNFETNWATNGPTIASTYASSYYYANANAQMTNLNASSYSNGVSTFAVPGTAPENIHINSRAGFIGFSVGDVIEPSLKVVKTGQSTDLLEACVRDEALPAVTVAASGSTAVVTITPPSSSAHFADFSYISLYVCEASASMCGQTVNGSLQYGFRYFSPFSSLTTSSTSATVSASTLMSGTMSTSGTWSTTSSYKYYVSYFGGQAVNHSATSALSAALTVSAPAPQSGGSSSGSSSSSTVVAESAKPLPVWAAPILKQIPTLSKTLTTDGGKIALTDGDFSSLKSVTVGGKEVAYSIDAKGDVNIPVPAGKGGTTADLVVVFTGGKMTVQDGIKYVEPTNVAAVREAPIAGFKGNSTKITGALAETIQYAAQLDKKANTVLCTGYAASQAAVATATARAEAACGYATKVNDLLVNKKVTIVVNAKLAKTAAVGIKVYK